MESKRESKQRTPPLRSDRRAGMANEAGRVIRETNYCTFKLSEP